MVSLAVDYCQNVFEQLWRVCMHVTVRYELKMFACVVIEAVCFVFQGFIPK